jgi:anti-sigma regulatory factor (Ser/Thr protein kinase)
MMVLEELLAPTPSAPRQARAAIRSRISHAVDPGAVECLALVATELVTNAVVHAGLDDGEGILLRMHVGGGRLRLEVEDHGAGFHLDVGGIEGACRAEGGDGGRGLMIVEKVADRWGLESREPTRVWAELRVTADELDPARAETPRRAALRVVPSPGEPTSAAG